MDKLFATLRPRKIKCPNCKHRIKPIHVIGEGLYCRICRIIVREMYK